MCTRSRYPGETGLVLIVVRGATLFVVVHGREWRKEDGKRCGVVRKEEGQKAGQDKKKEKKKENDRWGHPFYKESEASVHRARPRSVAAQDRRVPAAEWTNQAHASPWHAGQLGGEKPKNLIRLRPTSYSRAWHAWSSCAKQDLVSTSSSLSCVG